MSCKYCGAELPTAEHRSGGHRQREYCNPAHRQAYFRKQHQQDQAQGQTCTEMLAELVELRAKVSDQAHMIDEQASEIMRLRVRLDVDRRYLQDRAQSTIRGFRPWVKKRPSSPFIEKFLADRFLKPRDTLPHYE